MRDGPDGSAGARIARVLLLVQGGYYFLTGVWPLVHMPSFLAVTGPKTDLWLVRTVGGLITVIGAALLAAWYGRRASVETVVLAMGSAGVLMLVDVIYSLGGVISRIYLLDAAPEAVLILAWAVALGMRGRASS